MRLPLFPLQTVLLPGAHLPLHIFEPRYRQLTADLMDGTVPDRRFGVIAIKGPAVRDVDSPDQLHAFGCAALLREATPLPDGRFEVVTTGQRRFRLLELDTRAAPYLVGTIEWVDDAPLPAYSGEAGERLAELARAAHQRYCDAAWDRDSWQPPPPETELAELAYVLAADCILPLGDRQALLEELQPLRRLQTVCHLLTREAGFLSQLRAVPGPLTEATSVPKLNLN